MSPTYRVTDVDDPAGMVDRPLAADGLVSFRYRGQFGWVMTRESE